MKKLIFLSLSLIISHLSFSQSSIDTFIKADSLLSKGQLEIAEKYLLQMSDDNPYNGFYNYLLGINYHNKKEYEMSNTQLRKAQKLNWYYISNYFLARNYVSINCPDSAIYYLKEYIKTPFKGPEIDEVLSDTIFNSLHSLPKFDRLLPPKISEPDNEVEGWLIDIEYLSDMLKKTHYDPYFKLNKAEWEKEIKQLKSEIPKLATEQVLVRICQFIANMGDAHTRVLGFKEYDKKFGYFELPFDVQIFSDGCYVIQTIEEYNYLLGAKILKVNNISFDTIFKIIKTLIPSENEMWCKREFNSYFKNVNLLSGTGISHSKDSITIEFAINDKFYKKNIAILTNKVKIKRVDYHTFSSSYAPIFLKNKFAPYTYKYIEDEKILYFQLNSITSNKENPLEQFCDSIKALCNELEFNAFVLDIRLNTGGGSHHNKTILKLLLSENINIKGKLFVVIGASTFSAAQNLSSDIEYYTEAIFIGEPTGSSPNFIGEINPFSLPHSGLVVSSSDVYHQRGLYSSDVRKWKAPDIYIPFSFIDFKNGTDPVLIEIIKYTRK